MTAEDHVAILARLEALEALVVIAMSGSYITAGLELDQVRASNAALLEKYRIRTIDGAPAVLGDHYADEVRRHLQASLDRLVRAFADADRAGQT
jgi:hypothetical protein